MHDWNAVGEALRLGGWVMYPLSALAVIALAIMIERTLVLQRYASVPRSVRSYGEVGGSHGPEFSSGIGSGIGSGISPGFSPGTRPGDDPGNSVVGAPWDDFSNLPHAHVYRRIATTLRETAHQPQWWAEARIEAVAAQIDRELKRGLWVLETIVTAAPLLGLLGTIVGMMHSFQLIGGNGLVNPTGVTGGVAQALIATAVGLVIALAALFAFNYLARHTDNVIDELESFCTHRLNVQRLGRERKAAPA
jgi:biopolymer transport protein ExbB